jgi:hypothetical protein
MSVKKFFENIIEDFDKLEEKNNERFNQIPDQSPKELAFCFTAVMIVAIVVIIYFAHKTDFLNSTNQVPEKEVEEKVIARTVAGKVFEKRTEKIRNKKISVMTVNVFEEKKFNEQNSIIKKIEKDFSRQK